MVWMLFEKHWCSSFHMQINFHSDTQIKLIFMWMKIDLHMKGWAPRLALKKRPEVIRKWAISYYLKLKTGVSWFASSCLLDSFWAPFSAGDANLIQHKRLLRGGNEKVIPHLLWTLNFNEFVRKCHPIYHFQLNDYSHVVLSCVVTEGIVIQHQIDLVLDLGGSWVQIPSGARIFSELL